MRCRWRMSPRPPTALTLRPRAFQAPPGLRHPQRAPDRPAQAPLARSNGARGPGPAIAGRDAQRLRHFASLEEALDVTALVDRAAPRLLRVSFHPTRAGKTVAKVSVSSAAHAAHSSHVLPQHGGAPLATACVSTCLRALPRDAKFEDPNFMVLRAGLDALLVIEACRAAGSRGQRRSR